MSERRSVIQASVRIQAFAKLLVAAESIEDVRQWRDKLVYEAKAIESLSDDQLVALLETSPPVFSTTFALAASSDAVDPSAPPRERGERA